MCFSEDTELPEEPGTLTQTQVSQRFRLLCSSPPPIWLCLPKVPLSTVTELRWCPMFSPGAGTVIGNI